MVSVLANSNAIHLSTAPCVCWGKSICFASLHDANLQGKSNLVWAQEAVKWGADFLVNAVEEDQVLLHVGDISADHSYFGRPEWYPQGDRNIRMCTKGKLPQRRSQTLLAVVVV